MMILGIIILLIIDIVSKIIVSKNLFVGETIPIIKNFFNITYVRNTGVAWSMLSDKIYIILTISGLIILLIGYYVYKNRPKAKLERLAYSLILSGAIGNFIDRVIYGYVIDFFDFYIFGYNYPIFNLADTFIVMGIIMLIIVTWRNDKNEDRSRIRGSKNR